jgi:hypothetical protein
MMEQHVEEDRALRMTRTVDSRHIGRIDQDPMETRPPFKKDNKSCGGLAENEPPLILHDIQAADERNIAARTFSTDRVLTMKLHFGKKKVVL